MPVGPHQPPSSGKLPLPSKALKHQGALTVPKLPCISGVPRPCSFPPLFLETHAHPHLLPILKLPLSIPRARPPSPSPVGEARSIVLVCFLARPPEEALPALARVEPSRARRAPGALRRRGMARTSPSAEQWPGRAHGSLWRRPTGMAARRDLQPGRRGHRHGVSALLTHGASRKQTTGQEGGGEAVRSAAQRWLRNKRPGVQGQCRKHSRT